MRMSYSIREAASCHRLEKVEKGTGRWGDGHGESEHFGRHPLERVEGVILGVRGERVILILL